MPLLTELVALLRLAIKDRTPLMLENIALRHQLAVYKRSVGRPNIKALVHECQLQGTLRAPSERYRRLSSILTA